MRKMKTRTIMMITMRVARVSSKRDLKRKLGITKNKIIN